MNKKFENWILAKAAKIRTRQEVEIKTQQETQKLKWEEQAIVDRQIRININARLDNLAASMMKEPCHIKEGDRVILNKYDLPRESSPRESSNGWDGGAYTIISGVGEEEKNKPIYATIKEIYIDRSLTDDRIDKFLEQYQGEFNTKSNLDGVFGSYMNWIDRKKLLAYSKQTNYGLFKSATFDLINIENYAPTWGLGVESFLNANDEWGKTTLAIWNYDHDLYETQKTIKTLQIKINQLIAQAKIKAQQG